MPARLVRCGYTLMCISDINDIYNINDYIYFFVFSERGRWITWNVTCAYICVYAIYMYMPVRLFARHLHVIVDT